MHLRTVFSPSTKFSIAPVRPVRCQPHANAIGSLEGSIFSCRGPFMEPHLSDSLKYSWQYFSVLFNSFRLHIVVKCGYTMGSIWFSAWCHLMFVSSSYPRCHSSPQTNFSVHYLMLMTSRNPYDNLTPTIEFRSRFALEIITCGAHKHEMPHTPVLKNSPQNFCMLWKDVFCFDSSLAYLFIACYIAEYDPTLLYGSRVIKVCAFTDISSGLL